MKNVVFYSNSRKDLNSPKVVQFIKNMPFGKDFLYFCVDPDQNNKNKNDQLFGLLEITSIPTVYVQGKKIEGENIFQWLQMQYEQLQGGQRPPQQGGMYQQPMSRQVPPRNPMQSQQQIMGGQGQQNGGRQPIPNRNYGQQGQNQGQSHQDSGFLPSGDTDMNYPNPFMSTSITDIPIEYDEEGIVPIYDDIRQGRSDGLEDKLKQYKQERGDYQDRIPAGFQQGAPMGFASSAMRR